MSAAGERKQGKTSPMPRSTYFRHTLYTRAANGVALVNPHQGWISRLGSYKSVWGRRRREPTVRVFINDTEVGDHPSGAISFHQPLISPLRVVQHLVTPGGTLVAPQEVLMKTNLTQNGGRTYFLLRLLSPSPLPLSLSLPLSLLSFFVQRYFLPVARLSFPLCKSIWQRRLCVFPGVAERGLGIKTRVSTDCRISITRKLPYIFTRVIRKVQFYQILPGKDYVKPACMQFFYIKTKMLNILHNISKRYFTTISPNLSVLPVQLIFNQTSPSTLTVANEMDIANSVVSVIRQCGRMFPSCGFALLINTDGKLRRARKKCCSLQTLQRKISARVPYNYTTKSTFAYVSENAICVYSSEAIAGWIDSIKLPVYRSHIRVRDSTEIRLGAGKKS